MSRCDIPRGSPTSIEKTSAACYRWAVEDWMKVALDLARRAGARNEVPVGAVLVHDGKCIGQGANDRERSARTVAHAEITALEDYSRQTGQWRLPVGTTLYVTVEPCLMCVGALIWARVDCIRFGCTDPRGAGLLTLLPQIEAGIFDHRFERVEAGLEQTECAQLMKDFFRARRELNINRKTESTINPRLTF